MSTANKEEKRSVGHINEEKTTKPQMFLISLPHNGAYCTYLTHLEQNVNFQNYSMNSIKLLLFSFTK